MGKPIYHDVLLIRDQPKGTPGTRVERFAVDKETGEFKNGAGAPLEPVAFGHRPIRNLGSTGRATPEDPARGPVLSALPLHPSPAASSGTTCYLVNAQNLNYTTPWTAEEWNDHTDDVPDVEAPLRADTFALLIASPAGTVYYLEKKPGIIAEEATTQGTGGPARAPARGAAGSAEQTSTFDAFENEHFVFRKVELGLESEIWMQLRNGCVVGSVLFDGKPAAIARRDKVVPLVNIDSLTPRRQETSS